MNFEGSLSEPEEKNQKDEVSIVQLNRDVSSQLNLEKRVMELEKRLCEVYKKFEMKGKVSEKSLSLNGTFQIKMTIKLIWQILRKEITLEVIFA